MFTQMRAALQYFYLFKLLPLECFISPYNAIEENHREKQTHLINLMKTRLSGEGEVRSSTTKHTSLSGERPEGFQISYLQGGAVRYPFGHDGAGGFRSHPS